MESTDHRWSIIQKRLWMLCLNLVLDRFPNLCKTTASCICPCKYKFTLYIYIILSVTNNLEMLFTKQEDIYMKRQGPRLSSHLGRTPFGYQGVTSWSKVRHKRKIFLKTRFVWFQSLCSFDSNMLSQDRYLWPTVTFFAIWLYLWEKTKTAYFFRASALSIMIMKSYPLTVKSRRVHSVLLVEAQCRHTVPLTRSWDLPLLDAGPWALCVVCSISHLIMFQNSGGTETRKKYTESWKDFVSMLIEDPPIDVTVPGEPMTLGMPVCFPRCLCFPISQQGLGLNTFSTLW